MPKSENSSMRVCATSIFSASFPLSVDENVRRRAASQGQACVVAAAHDISPLWHQAYTRRNTDAERVYPFRHARYKFSRRYMDEYRCNKSR